MPFGATFVTPTTQTPENVFMRLSQGNSIVRIVSDEESSYLALIMKVSVGGDRQDWRTVPYKVLHPTLRNLADSGEDGHIRIQRRFVMNVLDRTDRRIAPKLKLLDIGRAVMEQFVQIAKQLRDPSSGDRIPIQKCDLIITTTGTGIKTRRSVFPDLTKEGLQPLEVPSTLINPFDHIFFFTPEEQLELLNGANYNDFIAEKRKAVSL